MDWVSRKFWGTQPTESDMSQTIPNNSQNIENIYANARGGLRGGRRGRSARGRAGRECSRGCPTVPRGFPYGARMGAPAVHPSFPYGARMGAPTVHPVFPYGATSGAPAVPLDCPYGATSGAPALLSDSSYGATSGAPAAPRGSRNGARRGSRQRFHKQKEKKEKDPPDDNGNPHIENGVTSGAPAVPLDCPYGATSGAPAVPLDFPYGATSGAPAVPRGSRNGARRGSRQRFHKQKEKKEKDPPDDNGNAHIENVNCRYRDMLKDIHDAIQYVSTWEDWLGNEPCFLKPAKDLYRFYEDLRRDMKENASSWSYEKYCERIAEIYFNVATCYKDELLQAGKITGESIKKHLDKCSENFVEERFEDAVEDLENATGNFNAEVNNFYLHQSVKLPQITTNDDNLSFSMDYCNMESGNQLFNGRNEITLQDIQLLRVINTLEAAITMPRTKIHYQIAIQYCCLGHAYKLAGEFNLSTEYAQKVKEIVSQWKHFKPDNCENKKEQIRQIIEDDLHNNRNHFNDIVNSIEATFARSIDPTDLVFIEDMYMDSCSKLWLKEVQDTLTQFVVERKKNDIRKIFNSLNSIKTLTKIPSPFCELKRYKILTENINLITPDQERNLLIYFKRECCEKVIAYNKNGKHELKSLEALANFLSKTLNLKDVIKKIELEKFCNEKLSWSEFMKNILRLDENSYGKELKVLQKSINCLDLREELFFIEEFRKFAADYMKPVESRERKVDNRSIIEIKARNINLSDHLDEIESKLSKNPDISEVRFIGTDIVHLEKDLKKAIWHGKNIIIITKILKVHKPVTWDVSGEDNNHVYLNNAGTDSNGNGMDGNDGYAGESGGNVLILTENIENPQHLTIISNGGRGSKGQDGGNGINGCHGKGISKASFDKEFPAFNSFWKLFSVSDNIESIKNHIKKKSIGFNSKPCPGGEFIQLKLADGSKITFCVYYRTSAYLLHEGSEGTPGGEGGEFGLGGEGGHYGEIIVKNPVTQESFNVKIIAKYGTSGEDGEGGLHGKHGLNGWDMGYTDRLYQPTQFFGIDERSKLKLEYYTVQKNGSVWCPHKNRYMVIREIPIEHQQLKTYKQRQNTRKNNDRKQHAQATRKKNICEQTVLDEYSDSDHFIDRGMFNLLNHLKNPFQQALEMTLDNQKQEAEITTEVSVRRQVHFYQQEERRETNEKNSIRVSSEQPPNFERLVEELVHPENLLKHWQRLECIPLNLSQWDKINQIFKYTIKKENFNNRKLNHIENLLKEKYLFANLQEISGKMTFKNEKPLSRLSSLQAERFLIESKAQDKRFHHAELGNLSQYLFKNTRHQREQREQLIKLCKNKFENETCDDFLESIRSFVLEVGNNNKTEEIIKEFYNVYKSFYMNVIYEAFINELSHSRNTFLYDLWMRAMEDKSLEKRFEKEIQKDKFLHKLYNRHKIQEMTHWGSCFRNMWFRSAYYEHLQYKGLRSRAYWDLLAYAYGVNIRLYAYDQDNRILLLGDYCTSARKCVHVLSKADRLVSLELDENYLKLHERRRCEDIEYGKILREVDQLTTKTEVEHYFKKFSSFEEPSEHKDNHDKGQLIPNLKEFFQRKTEAIKLWVSNNGHETQNHQNIADNTVSSMERSTKKERIYDEHQLINKIADYFPEGKNEIIQRLKKLKFQCTRQKGILISLFRRLSCEGRHVSYGELCYLVNAVLSSCVENRTERNTFAWIISAYSQRQWTDQVTLLQLEDYFRRPLEDKAKWLQYLSKIGNKDIPLLLSAKLEQSNSVSEQCIDETLYLLSSIPNEVVVFGDLELSEWSYALKDKYWENKLKNTLNWQKNYADLQRASYYTISMENAFGAELVNNLLQVISQEKEKLPLSIFIEILSNFYSERWTLTTLEIRNLQATNIREWNQAMQQKFNSDNEDRSISKLVELVEENKNTSRNIIGNLQIIDRDVQLISENNYELNNKKVCDFQLGDDVSMWISSISKDSGNIEKDILAVIDRVVKIKKGFKLRDTQKLTVLTLLTNKKSTLAQVSTGEGKSLIVVAASIIKALRGETVDIITSSSVLAIRDATVHNDIYSAFNIAVGHNCSEKKEDRRKAYSKNQVVYGDLSSFQRDYLLDKFYDENILGDRQYRNVIVDEVDSMLLDQGNNMLYLSHDLEDFDKLESVYIYIWQWINRPTLPWEQVSQVLNPQEIKKAVLVDIYGAISLEDLAKLGSDLKKNQQDALWKRLVNSRIIQQDGKILIQSLDDLAIELSNLDLQELSNLDLQDLVSYKDRLHFLLKERIQREKRIHVPNYLRSFIELHLDKWIENAITAMFMQVDHDYVVDVDRTGSSPDRNPNIIILDRDTGTDQSNSQWEEGLHQFLQLKHGCKLSLQSLKAVFISNVSFFKLYDKLYGLTGTLGSQCERDLLKEIHDVDFVTIPTAKTKKFDEHTPIICTSFQKWVENITTSAMKMAENRSALIICETVDVVKQLKKAFCAKRVDNVHTYTRDYEKFEMEDNGLLKGQIIIATNLAGRGTDIKISDELEKNGGLHVYLTYLPKNIRIEQQAFGRAARSGDRGSGQLIIFDVSRSPKSLTQIINLKKTRDSDELHRISEIRSHYEAQIRLEEKCFHEFKEQYERLKRKLVENDAPKEIKDILLRSCLDKWAFWLDTNGKSVKGDNCESLLSTFICELSQLYSDTENVTFGNWVIQALTPKKTFPISKLYGWVEENPVQMTNLAKYLAQNKKVDDAIELFNKVIGSEPRFSDAAHYYKAFALTKRENWSECESECKRELLEAAKLFERRIETAIYASSVISNMKQRNNKLIQIESFEEQKRNVCNIYWLFLQSIADILGHPVSAQSFVNKALNINEDLAEDFYEELLKLGYIRKPRLKDNVNERELKSICYDYGLNVTVLKSFLFSDKPREICEKAFQKDFKKKIQLPSREAFWKELLKNNVLSDEVKFVVIEDEKLKKLDSELLESLEHNLRKQLLKINEDEVMLYPEIIGYQDKNKCIFRKDDFITTIDPQKYRLLKRMGVLTKNKKARFNLNKCAGVKFASNDSLGPEDLINRIGITEVEARRILSELVKKKVITKVNESRYNLRISFKHINSVKIHFCSLYEDSVKALLFHCFSYRIYLQMIEKHIKYKTYKLPPFLRIKPHQSLICELLERKIITPSTVDGTRDMKLLLKSTEDNPTKHQQYKYIVGILERKRSTLETIQKVHGSLQRIVEVIDLSSCAEAGIFILDGLEHILNLEEKKWKMILSSSVVVLMGIAQVVIGCLISMFWMISVANAFINEGVNDIFFGLEALRSGYFSWNDYFKRKVESVTISASAAFLSTLRSNCNRFGQKLFGSAVNNEAMGETCRRSIINVGCEEVSKQVRKRIALKILHASAYGAANMALDSWVPNALQSLSDEIAKSVLFDIENKVTNHSVMGALKEALRRLGPKKTKEIIQIATESAINNSSFHSSMQQLLVNLSKGFSEIMAKYNASGLLNAVSGMDNIVSDVLVHIKNVLKICNPGRILTEFLDDVKDSLNSELNEARRLNNWQESGEDTEKLLQEISAQWIASTREELSRILLTKVINPVLNIGGKYLNGYIERKIKNTYDSYSEIDHQDEFNKIKPKYDNTESKPEQTKSSWKPAENLYSKELLNLTKQKQDPILFANIIRENVPLDVSFVDATIGVVHTVLNQIGSEIGTLKFFVEDENGVVREFTSKQNGTKMRSIRIDLQNNNFYILRNEEMKTKNNCLFDSLHKEIDSLRTLKPWKFRNLIADCIQNDRDIQNYLKHSWRRSPKDLVMYGGATEGSECAQHNGTSNKKEHFFSRFTSLNWGAAARRFKEIIGMPEEELIRDGVSQSHCQLPKKIFSNKNQLRYSNELLNLLDHTQNVRKYVSMASAVGQNIDKIQHDLMRIAAEIDCITSFDDIFETKITNIKNKTTNTVNTIFEQASAKDKYQLNALRKFDNACKNIKHFDSITPSRVMQERARKIFKFNITLVKLKYC